jgi:hypothetical protein
VGWLILLSVTLAPSSFAAVAAITRITNHQSLTWLLLLPLQPLLLQPLHDCAVAQPLHAPPPQVYGTQSVHTFLHTNQPWKSYLEDGGNFKLMQPLVPAHQLTLLAGLCVVLAAVPHRAWLLVLLL